MWKMQKYDTILLLPVNYKYTEGKCEDGNEKENSIIHISYDDGK